MDEFEKLFGKAPKYRFSAPGRTEIGGNHTDHQHGCVLAAAIDLKTTAYVAENGTDTVRVQSEGYPLCEVRLSELAPDKSEAGTTTALVRGICACFAQMGAKLRGFDAYITSSVLAGSGLSSSACFEVLTAQIVNTLFYGGKCSAMELAIIGQKAENDWFFKPCGLMDQAACASGGIISLDFENPSAPISRKLEFDFKKNGYALCIIDSGASHADLTDEYAAVTREMRTVAQVFGRSVLREVKIADFYANLGRVRAECGDRAALRAMHFFDDNERAKLEYAALSEGKTDEFLRLVNESGNSSQLLLQNVIPTGATAHQEVAAVIAYAKKLLGKSGAVRVHGGGFAGTVQAFVPCDMLDSFKMSIDSVFGENACHILNVVPDGAILEETYK